MGRGRPRGYKVTHAATREWEPVHNEHTGRLIRQAGVRCTCGRPFRADTLDQARADHSEHLDRVEAAGKAVRRG